MFKKIRIFTIFIIILFVLKKYKNNKEWDFMKKLNIFDVANWFLSKEEMTHKKLQKLCYYAL